ncbi:hypothetical protein [Micromonospora sp. NBC_01796]|uniref:hypothetical protein n=1 Tax=Micromonospora sp. NBC_01796 TaxID=2975987 RepID=UPI002DD8C0EF|nr:hypothetical protein [Micromonospora sp. NBC_01796]WSA83389.1 hypothetical protein OIE47_23640 [Micromonospora sp. NBC_01796]
MFVMTPTAPAVARQPAQPDFALNVSPSRVLVPADQTARPRQFTVTNQGRIPADVVTRMESFTAGEDGDLHFRSDAPHSAAGWVRVQPERFRLDGGTAGQVSLHIAVPANAEPGEHQVAVIFSVSAPDGRTGIGVNRSVGVPVYVTVAGEAVDPVEATTATGGILPLRLIGLVLLPVLTLLLGGLLVRRRLVRRRLGRLGPPGPGLPVPVGNIDGDGRRSDLT